MRRGDEDEEEAAADTVGQADEDDDEVYETLPNGRRQKRPRYEGNEEQRGADGAAGDEEGEGGEVCLSITWKPVAKRGCGLGKVELDTRKLEELKKLVRHLHDQQLPAWKADGVLVWGIFRIERGDKKKGLHGQSALMVIRAAGHSDRDLCGMWRSRCLAAIAEAGITTLDWQMPVGNGIKVHDDPDDLIGYCEVKDAGRIWSERAMIGIADNKLKAREC